MTDEIDMDEAELLHLAMADYMLTGRDPPPQWRECDPVVKDDWRGLDPAAFRALGRKLAARHWRRVCMTGDWHKRIPLYLWIAVKKD
jgi:hypothetical protein